jgi:hypothetical protein
MDAIDFSRVVLSFPDIEEGSRMGRADISLGAV